MLRPGDTVRWSYSPRQHTVRGTLYGTGRVLAVDRAEDVVMIEPDTDPGQVYQFHTDTVQKIAREWATIPKSFRVVE